MSFCRRFVTYLFQYDNQTKGKNCGFAKVDARQGRCRMEIQMKGCEDGNYAVYLLRQSEQALIGLPIGEIQVGNGAGKTVLLFQSEKIGGSRFGLKDMQGMYLTAGKNNFVASQWEDGKLAWRTFRIYEERDLSEVVPDGADLHRVEDARPKEQSPVSNEEGAVADVGEEKLSEAVAQPEMQATQAAAAVDISPYMTAWEKRWQRFCALHPLLFPFDEEKNIYAVKMDLRDFRSLPKQYWQLANNSFLLHGYFNYKYILLGCEDGDEKRWFVAVPGVFQNQEQLLAGIFGFGEFRTKHVTRQKTGEFGFWYRYLELN